MTPIETEFLLFPLCAWVDIGKSMRCWIHKPGWVHSFQKAWFCGGRDDPREKTLPVWTIGRDRLDVGSLAADIL